MAVTHWKLFFKTFTETVCPTVHAKPCKKSTLCYSFLERRGEGAKPVKLVAMPQGWDILLFVQKSRKQNHYNPLLVLSHN